MGQARGDLEFSERRTADLAAVHRSIARPKPTNVHAHLRGDVLGGALSDAKDDLQPVDAISERV